MHFIDKLGKNLRIKMDTGLFYDLVFVYTAFISVTVNLNSLMGSWLYAS